MKKITYKTQADLFSYVLDKYVEDEETCIGEFCVKSKSQAYENLKAERSHLAEEWNRLTEKREKQIRAKTIEECINTLKIYFDDDADCIEILEKLKEQK